MKQKQTIKLNESQLRGLIKENIKKVLSEGGFRRTDYRDDGYFSDEALKKGRKLLVLFRIKRQLR